MKRISIGSWAYTIGPYADRPVAWDTVCDRLSDLGFDGVELGGFPPHPNPDDVPPAERAAIREGCLLYTSPSPRDQRGSRMPSSA